MKILFFTGAWCMACKAFLPLVENVAVQNNIDFEIIDIEENKGLVRDHNIKSLPTMVLLDDAGKTVKRWQGTRSKEELLKALEAIKRNETV